MYGKLTILVEKTLAELSVDVNVLSKGSHTKVFVKCDKCNCELLREYKLLSYKHRCSTHITKEGIKYKWCSKCLEFVDYEYWGTKESAHDKLASYCKKCSASRLDDFNKWIKHTVSTKRSWAARENVKFDLTSDNLIKLWDDQDGLCYYTNVKMVYHSNALNSAWLERIDSNAGYVNGNVVWVTKGINCLKNDASVDEFKEYITSIRMMGAPPVRVEMKKLHPDGKLPFRKRITDAGYDIFAINDVLIPAGGMEDVRTGIAVSAPPGYYFTVEPRSSLWIKGISPYHGIVDATYTGELMTALVNYGKEPYQVKKGDRIAQIILHEQHHMDCNEVEEFSPEYNQRGTAGFGASGR